MAVGDVPLTPIIDTVTGSVTEIGRIFLRTLTAAVGALAPIDAAYWTSRAEGVLSAEVNLGALASGYLKIANAIGVATPTTVPTIPQADVTGLPATLAGLAPLASPAFTGTPTAPTAAPGTITAQLATTAFVGTALGSGPAPPAAHHASHETGGSDAITALAGPVITTGTIADARLSGNVPLKAAANVFTATQRVARAQPILEVFDPAGTAVGRVFQAVPANVDVGLSGNLAFSVGGGFNADDVSQPGTLYYAAAGTHTFYTTTPGANPRPLNLGLQISAAGLTLGPGQIAFPAAQNPSANPNTLDDYEEGTWTPTVGGSTSQSGQTYLQQTGIYVKIGKTVIAWFAIQLSAVGTITGNVAIKGFPFVAANVTAGAFGTAPLFWAALATAFAIMQVNILVNDTTALVIALTAPSGGLTTQPVQADLGPNSIFRACVVYQAAA